MAKRVAIIGAGASGLCAAKYLVESTSYLPVIYDKRGEVGGLWSPSVLSDGTPSAAQMGGLRTNLSKWNCSFSDFYWGDNVKVFPTAAEVGEYLKRYKERFLPEGSVLWKLGQRVKMVEKVQNGKEILWSVTTNDGTKECYEALIMANGFFSRPYTPDIPGQRTFEGQVYHSSQLQQLVTKIRDGERSKKRKIVVVGGSLSAVEVVSELLFLNDETLEVQHISPRPFWVLPKQLPVDPSAASPTFLPLDLILYDANSTTPEDLSPERRKHLELSRLVDPKRFYTGDLSQVDDAPAWVVISDWYSRYLLDKRVELSHGRLSKIMGGGITIDTSEGGVIEISEVTDIVFATGYTPCPGISDILSTDLQEKLSFDPNDNFLPLVLLETQFSEAMLPAGAFIGMYKGPYFGIIENQARRIASWLAETDGQQLPMRSGNALGPKEVQSLRNERRTGVEGQWLFNYIAEMNRLATRTVQESMGIVDPIVPALYSNKPEHPDTTAQLVNLRQAIADEARYVPMAVWRAFHGRWKLYRSIISKNSFQPSGTMQGSASFTPRFFSEIIPKLCSITPDKLSEDTASTLAIPEVELLYSEEGAFSTQTSPPLQFNVYKNYVYRLDMTNETPVINTYFTSAEKNASDAKANGYFHDLQFRRNSEGRWVATGDHWCKPDTYIPEYEFWFDGVELRKWTLTYTVTGPKKDYVSRSTFTRM
ncbi:FAD/NAD(P)-binding domain-containing protein [Ascobolus immersus RN42]|uniref:FAD/NAD(P)-binding domain-containing protein n=1 Tax=Ascobolus immersus RN42 TaxID=1160509 RepID=A0A3N4HMS5_ASCIM|nr:FAD/NAD(P)-binding domain-containing protein [Ascobolus immersus RN42]